jgi:lipoate-protein ligase A
MAVDDALLDSALPEDTAVLRLYRWSPACLSLGYFQSSQDRATHQDSIAADCVRRASGGGAILHDQELTYSFIFPASNLSSTQISGIYDLFHDSLISVLQKLGIPAVKCMDPPTVDRNNQPFLCFLRRSSGDVLLHEAKIIGSAQRRNKTHVLQHGSILLKRSPFSPELPGILELVDVDLTSLSWVNDWLENLTHRLQCQLTKHSLSHDQLKAAHKIETDRFLNPNWLHKR